MSNKIWYIVGIIVVIAALGFFYNAYRTSQVAQPTPEAQATAQPTPAPTAVKEIMVELAEINNSSESGTAKISEVDGKVMVAIELTGAPATTAQPAHLHVGTCPGVGDIKYPLTNVVNGKSETTLETTFDTLMTELPLALNVHKSTPQIKVYVACGDLKAPQ